MVATAPDEMLRAAIDRFVGQFAVGRMTREDLVASIVTASAETRLERTPAEAMAARSAAYLAKYDEFGGGVEAAGKVGRFFGQDPLECDRIAQRVRAHARARRDGRPARPRGRPQKKAN